MRIKGKYQKELKQGFLDCLVDIDGKHMKLFLQDNNTKFFDLKQPKYKEEWKFRKINSLDENPCDFNRKTKYNHVIEYFDDAEVLRNVFVKSMWTQRIIIKNNQREKPRNLKTIALAVLGFLLLLLAEIFITEFYKSVIPKQWRNINVIKNEDNQNQRLDKQSPHTNNSLNSDTVSLILGKDTIL